MSISMSPVMDIMTRVADMTLVPLYRRIGSSSSQVTFTDIAFTGMSQAEAEMTQRLGTMMKKAGQSVSFLLRGDDAMDSPWQNSDCVVSIDGTYQPNPERDFFVINALDGHDAFRGGASGRGSFAMTCSYFCQGAPVAAWAYLPMERMMLVSSRALPSCALIMDVADRSYSPTFNRFLDNAHGVTHDQSPAVDCFAPDGGTTFSWVDQKAGGVVRPVSGAVNSLRMMFGEPMANAPDALVVMDGGAPWQSWTLGYIAEKAGGAVMPLDARRTGTVIARSSHVAASLVQAYRAG